MASGQFVDVSTSVSIPLSSDLSKPGSTSFFNSTSVVSFGTSSSSIFNSTSVARFGNASSSSMAVSSTSQLSSFSSSSENGFSSSPPSSNSSQTGSPSATNPGSSASVQQTSELGSTTTAVIVVPETSWTSITTQPASTLSAPVVLTTTNSIGLQVVTTPPLVTIWSTSTDSNGTLITATAVVANSPQADLASEHGILHNTGAVAGIFTVIGLIFAGLVVCMVVCIRRSKTFRRRTWLAEMYAKQPYAEDPFRDGSLPPEMRTVHTDAENDPWPRDRKGFLVPEDSSRGHPTFSQSKASIFPVYPISKDGTSGQPEIHQQTIDMSLQETNEARYSMASSTPSIYPVGMEDEDKVSNDIVIVPNFNQSATTSNAPPRPPRSLLRESRIKVLSAVLPPPSESEHSNQTNIVSEPRSRDDVHVLEEGKPQPLAF